MAAPGTVAPVSDGHLSTEEQVCQFLGAISHGRRWTWQRCPYCGSARLHRYQKLAFAYEWRTRCLSCRAHLGTDDEQNAAIRARANALCLHATSRELEARP